MLFYTPDQEQLQKQSQSNHQGRSGQSLSDSIYTEAAERWEKGRKDARSNYEWLTQQDVARELARIDLPLSTYTQWYWKIDLHNLLHFLKLRVDAHAQWEIQQFGEVMAGMVRCVAPLSYEAWIDYDVCGARLSRMELNAVRELLEVDESGSIQVRPGASLNRQQLLNLGHSSREIEELVEKLRPAEAPSYETKVEDSVSPEVFEQRCAAAVPTGNSKPE
jgi:thymidylate synthase (FAD)